MPEVTLIDRGRVRADTAYVIDGYSMASAENPNPDHELIDFVVWNAVVETDAGTFLWDTGCPENAAEYWPDPLYGAFEAYDAEEHALEDDLRKNGYELDDIDGVVMSHLHLDHAGQLDRFEGRDVPVYVHEEELKFAYYSAKTDGGSIAYLAPDFDRDLNWEIVHRDTHTIADGFELHHLPGHTPGVLGARIETAEGTLLIAGDEAYVDANYTDEVPLGPGLLWSERAWRESLYTLKELDRVYDCDVLHGHDLGRFEELVGKY